MKPHKIYRKFTDPHFPLQGKRLVKKTATPFFLRIHWHTEPEFVYIAQGRYEVYDPQGNYTIHEGDLCLFPPGKEHCIRAIDSTSEYWTIYFSLDLISMQDSHFFQQAFVAPMRSGSLHIPPVIHTTQKMAESLAVMMDTDKENYQKFSALIDLCSQIMPLCSQQSTSLQIPAEHSAVQQCHFYISANYASKLTLEELAAHVHLHPNYLCHLFKENTGQTVFDYLTHVRIHHARILLRETKLTIAQIAYQTGFSGVDYFTKKFKESMNMTPTQYRKSFDNL